MFTNRKNIPLPLAVMIATDNYDYHNQPKTISTTSLLKSVKSIILSSQVIDVSNDISSYVPSRMGNALHDAMEQAWKNPTKALKSLGYSDIIIQRLIESTSFEIRSSRKINGYTLTGKYDCVMGGTVYDLKSTSAWKWVFGDMGDFQKQLSIYKWLNPEVITNDIGKIMFWFTDWSAKNTIKSDYPQFRIQEKTLALDSPDEIEAFISSKLTQLDIALETKDLPDCTDKELWRKPNVWAYYSKATNKSASKVFNNANDAYDWCTTKGKGDVLYRPGEVVACAYCNAKSICQQAEQYILSGELKREII